MAHKELKYSTDARKSLEAGVDKDKLVEDMTKRLTDEFPGVDFNFSQYIEDNVEEAASGVKGENSVKLFGNDLAALEKAANDIKRVLGTVPGITDLAVFNSLGQPTVTIKIDRARGARYGLSPGDITLQAGGNVTLFNSVTVDGAGFATPVTIQAGSARPSIAQ